MEWDVIALLSGVAFIAGFIDSIAGGGGLLTLPAFLLTGVNPVVALGTNKLQSFFGASSATFVFGRAGHIEWRSALPYAFLSMLAGACGALLATSIPKAFLSTFIPILLVIVALYFALSPKMGDKNARSRLSPLVFGLTIPPLLGFYDGIFGPGTGSFFMLAFVTLLGYGITKATGHTKLLNLGSNIGALSVFLYNGTFILSVGIIMGACAFIGAQLGSRAAMRFGSQLIRPLLVIVCICMAIRLLMDSENPIRQFFITFVS